MELSRAAVKKPAAAAIVITVFRIYGRAEVLPFA